MYLMSQLPVFPSDYGLPKTDQEIHRVLHSKYLREVQCFALGPEGTNIVQACRLWIDRMDIGEKTSISLCESPEASIKAARTVTEHDKLGVFWTCAVFHREKDIFFDNPDTYPFFSQEVMRLDSMQLATRRDLAAHWTGIDIPVAWRIASHPSPSVLLKRLPHEVMTVRSNAEAALYCAAGECEACITTESARLIHGLEKLHSFGCPRMIFFVGITAHGAELVKDIFAGLSLSPVPVVEYAASESYRHLSGTHVEVNHAPD